MANPNQNQNDPQRGGQHKPGQQQQQDPNRRDQQGGQGGQGNQGR